MNHEEWHADIELNEDSAKHYIENQFPNLSPIQKIRYLGEGWDNQIFIINQNLIFRFPRRKASIQLMNCESKILSHLPNFKLIKTPRLLYQGSPTTLHPYPCQGYEMLAGCSGYQADLSEDDRRNNIGVLANFLKELHGITKENALSMGVVPQGSGSRTNIPETLSVLNERCGKLYNRKILKINLDCLQNEMNQASKIVLPLEQRFVHGDLDSRHLIFNDKKLTGIIDWGDTDICNRAVDLDIIWTFFPRDSHDTFFEIYGEVEKSTWQYARFLGIYCGFSLALYAYDLNDTLLFSESVNALNRINEELIISK